MNMNQNIFNSSFISPPPRNIPYESSYTQNSRNNVFNGIHSRLSSVTNMFYPPSNAFNQPPTPVLHRVKRTASSCYNDSTYDHVSKRSYVSTSITNDLRRFQNDTVHDSRHNDVTYTPDQFDAIRFTPVSGVTPKETVSDILNKPITSTAIEEEAIGHLSFSDLSDSFLPEEPTPPSKQLQPSKTEFLQTSQENHDLGIQFKKEGNRLYEQHDYKTAIVNYTISLSYNPSDPIVFSNRAACFLSINKPRKALKDALRAIELDPSFIRGYCRAGKCHLLQGHLPQAKELYDKSLSLLLQNQREGKEVDCSRLNECENAIRIIKSVMKQNESLPSFYNSPQEVQSTIRILLSIKENCYGWRDLYIRLIQCYLLLQDTASAEIALSHITPSILPSLNQIQHHLIPVNYPFGIEGWDAEELDIFNQDVSGVDVEVMFLWYQLFILKGEVEKVLLLRTMMKNEPRFRDYRTARQLLSPFDFLEKWNIKFIDGKTLYEEKRYTDCLNKCSSCIDDIQHFIQMYGNKDFSVSFHKSRRFSSWLNNILFDTLLCDCSILTVRCLYHCENYQGVIEECGRVLSLHEDCAFAYKRRGQAYCILHLFDSGLADIRRYLSYMPKDNKMIHLYSHIQARAKGKLPFSSTPRGRLYHGLRKEGTSSFKPNQESFKSRFEASFQSPEQASEESSTHKESESQQSWRSPIHSRSTYHNYYSLLGVSKNASEREIRQSYRRLALQYHPDKNPSQEAQNLFVRIKEAYDVLSDPDKRRKYDVSY